MAGHEVAETSYACNYQQTLSQVEYYQNLAKQICAVKIPLGENKKILDEIQLSIAKSALQLPIHYIAYKLALAELCEYENTGEYSKEALFECGRRCECALLKLEQFTSRIAHDKNVFFSMIKQPALINDIITDKNIESEPIISRHEYN